MNTLLLQTALASSTPLELLLVDQSYAVTRCDATAPAIARISLDRFDLVVVDLAVPGIEIHAFVKTVRSQAWGVWCQILVVSPGGDRDEIDQALHAGADDYITPLEPPELMTLRLSIAQRRAEENAARCEMISALTTSTARFRELLETTPDGILRVGVDGRIQLANGQAERMTGYSRDELIGQPVEMLVPAAFRGPHVAQRTAFVRNPATRPMGSRANLLLACKDGSELAIDICLGHHRDDGEEYVIAAIRDVTERRRLETELRLAKDAAERAYDQIRRDMDAASRLQRELLPTTLPTAAGVRFAWEFRPCAGLAGDGLNIFRLDDDHIGFYLLDVSGHGVAAALLSVTLTRLLSPTPSQASLLWGRRPGGEGQRILPPADVARQLNDWLLANPSGEQFFTLFYGILELSTRRLRFVSAAHPGLIRAGHGMPPVSAAVPGFPIGFTPVADYEEQTLDLAAGDRLYLFSDGLSEAIGPGGEPFGGGRLERLLSTAGDEPLERTPPRVMSDVLRWTDNEPQDDLSFMAVAID